ncbi:mannosyltransferase [Nocardia sp. NPDC006630]|uniref:mannosyltransferase n=1 Tax=Nocardia sp. NPDC006630 TaxID=3157181 RepID=UPI0033B1C1E6
MPPELKVCAVNRHFRLAVAALVLSVLARLAWVLLLPNGMNFVDLHVYMDGSAGLGSGTLYDYTDASKTPDFPLPFTYPPFAALVFYPLHFLPFTLVALAWLLATMAALYGVVWIALELILGKEALREQHWRTAAVAWTAVGLWLEPVRTTLDYGQVNVFLVLLAMLAVRSTRWWVSGTLIGVAAGVKLTPAVTGLYFLTQRRWLTAVWSAIVFAGTVGLTFLISPGETRKYFGELLGDATRIGPVATASNQSLRGSLSRILGHDVQTGPLWIAAVLVTAVLAVLAWRALGSGDRLGTLIIVQFFGLLASPISWSHHWIWLIPTILWLCYGPLRAAAGARILAGYWLVVTLIGVPWVLMFFQPTIWTISRPGILSWLGTVYTAGVLVFYLWVIRVGRISPADAVDRSRAQEPHPAR